MVTKLRSLHIYHAVLLNVLYKFCTCFEIESAKNNVLTKNAQCNPTKTNTYENDYAVPPGMMAKILNSRTVRQQRRSQKLRKLEKSANIIVCQVDRCVINLEQEKHGKCKIRIFS